MKLRDLVHDRYLNHPSCARAKSLRFRLQPRTNDMRHLLKSFAAFFVLVGYYLCSPWVYLFLALWSVFPTRDPAAKTQSLQHILHRCFRGLHRITRALRIQHYVPAAPAHLPTPSVMVANHPTLMDVTAILATVPHTVTVVKPSIFRRPLLGTVLRRAGYLEGPGRSTQELARMIRDAQSRLEQGYNVLIFPEGTRSPMGNVLPFSRAAFEIACRAKVPLVPITIRCTPPWLSKELPVYVIPRATAHMTVNFLAPQDPADVDYQSRILRENVRNVIVDQLQ